MIQSAVQVSTCTVHVQSGYDECSLAKLVAVQFCSWKQRKRGRKAKQAEVQPLPHGDGVCIPDTVYLGVWRNTIGPFFNKRNTPPTHVPRAKVYTHSVLKFSTMTTFGLNGLQTDETGPCNGHSNYST